MSMKKTLLLSAISFAAFAQIASAAKIQVINENKKELEIKIVAVGDSNATSKRTISAEHTSEFDVKEEELNGKKHFDVEGSVNIFTPNSTCKNIPVDGDDVRLTFHDDKVGTTCIAEKLDADGKVVAAPAA